MKIKTKNVVIIISVIFAAIFFAIVLINRKESDDIKPIKADAVTGVESHSNNKSSKVTKPAVTTKVKTEDSQVQNDDSQIDKVTSDIEDLVKNNLTITTLSNTTYNCFSNIGYIPSDEELKMMCVVVSSETGYCDDAAQKAVAHTIINRVLDDTFPNSIYGVVTQEGQYTAIHSYYDGYYREGLYPGSDLWNHSMELCIEAMNEWDFTNGATAYYNPEIIGYNEWFESLQLVYVDSHGRFFKTYD